MTSAPWLVVIDAQRIFADPASEWCAPRFAETVNPIRELAEVAHRYGVPLHTDAVQAFGALPVDFADVPPARPIICPAFTSLPTSVPGPNDDMW